MMNIKGVGYGKMLRVLWLYFNSHIYETVGALLQAEYKT